MTLSVLWTIGMAASVLYGCYIGTASQLTSAFMEGLQTAVDFFPQAGIMMVFWCGLFAAAEDAGSTDTLAKLLRPLLHRIFPVSTAHPDVCTYLSANVSANLLGLGNAATPMGICAAQRMAALPHNAKELACLVVMNTASIQLLPTTIAALRAGLGSTTPFDIIPCVLLTSVLSVAAGLLTVRLLYRL